MSDCLFCKIVAGEVPADVVARGERTLAFRDVMPQAPTHVLVVPVDHHPDLASLAAADVAYAGEVCALAGEVARLEGVDATGYRVVANTGDAAHQSVPHLHLHVLGGRDLTWPPG